jgi:hypothetical protein
LEPSPLNQANEPETLKNELGDSIDYAALEDEFHREAAMAQVLVEVVCQMIPHM